MYTRQMHTLNPKQPIIEELIDAWAYPGLAVAFALSTPTPNPPPPTSIVPLPLTAPPPSVLASTSFPCLPLLMCAHSKAHVHSLVVQGVRRPPLPDYLEVKRCFAVHECGKALVAIKLREKTGRLEQVERVSIVPRGRSDALPLPPSPLLPRLPPPPPPHPPHPTEMIKHLLGQRELGSGSNQVDGSEGV